MKANQNFVRADEAVSPVIGVILMVAITVVLGAVVFVLVGNLTESGDDAPSITFIKNAQNSNLTVQSVDWGGTALTWTGTGTGATDIQVSGCTVVTEGTTDTTLSPASVGTVSAGDRLGTCSGQVTIVHVATDSLIYSTTFS